MRIISSLLVLIAFLFVVQSADVTQVSLIRYCTGTQCSSSDAKPSLTIDVDSCAAYTDTCNSMLSGFVNVQPNSDDKTKFGIQLFKNSCDDTPIYTTDVVCGVCTDLKLDDISLGQYLVECPKDTSSSNTNDSSASSVVLSTAVVLASIIAALL